MQKLASEKNNFSNETNKESKSGKIAENKFERAKKWWLCDKNIKLDGETKVREVCLLTR